MPKSRFSGKKPFKKDRTIPNNKPILYKILNSGGNNFYTGTAKKVREQHRLEEHLPGSKDTIKGGKFFRYKQMPSIKNDQKEKLQAGIRGSSR